MNTVIIMLGSNSSAEINIGLAIKKLSSRFKIIKESSVITSKPVGSHYLSDFRNKAIKLSSNKTLKETVSILKSIEIEIGRTPDSKQLGIIPIDIDLIFWNENQVHTDYDRFEFVKECVDEIQCCDSK